MVYPHELLMVPSPVAIFKDADHKDNAKKFVDYLTTAEAQQMIAEAGTVPARRDVTMPERYNLPTPEDAFANGIKVSYAEVLANKNETVKKFSNLFK